MDKMVIGIIGMGEMGKMYARRLSTAGWRYDAPSLEKIKENVILVSPFPTSKHTPLMQ